MLLLEALSQESKKYYLLYSDSSLNNLKLQLCLSYKVIR